VLVGIVMLRFPEAMLALLLGAVVLVESTDTGLLPTGGALYNVVGHVVTPVDLLLFGALAGTLIRISSDNANFTWPNPMSPALWLVVAAMAAGVITGAAAHQNIPGGELYHRAMNGVYIVVIPFIIVNLVKDTRALRLFVVAAVALAAIKGLSGTYAILTGTGSNLEGATASYLTPVGNVICMLLVLGVVTAAVRRIRMPLWVWAGGGLALASLLLSYRRSFWIALIIGLIMVVIIASRYRGRTVLVLGIVVAALGTLAITTIGSGQTATTGSSPLTERVQSINPTGEDTNRGDRYRVDERKNVIANLEEHPLTGLGLGVQWRTHYPTAEAHDRSYVHFAFLWWWMALGLFGAVAYVALMGGSILTAGAVWRKHPDPLIQAAAIAVAGTMAGVVFVELTTTFTGVEPRFSIFVGAIVGWLAAAWQDAGRERRRTAA
jgi:O-antigen ligase